MPETTVTRDELEELVRQGEANELKAEILARVYEWRGNYYYCRYTDVAGGGSGWVVETEPRPVHTPPPPSALSQIIAIVLDARQDRTLDPASVAVRDSEAFGKIVRVLATEGLL
jgi:hypothetical protein